MEASLEVLPVEHMDIAHMVQHAVHHLNTELFILATVRRRVPDVVDHVRHPGQQLFLGLWIHGHTNSGAACTGQARLTESTEGNRYHGENCEPTFVVHFFFPLRSVTLPKCHMSE